MTALTTHERFRRTSTTRRPTGCRSGTSPGPARWPGGREGMPEACRLRNFDLDKVAGSKWTTRPAIPSRSSRVRPVQNLHDPLGRRAEGVQASRFDAEFIQYTITTPEKWQAAKRRMSPATTHPLGRAEGQLRPLAQRGLLDRRQAVLRVRLRPRNDRRLRDFPDGADRAAPVVRRHVQPLPRREPGPAATGVGRRLPV